jgi:hypothetical protein
LAHFTQVTGAVSELKTMQALMSNGWEVASPAVAEVYDLVAKDPLSNEWRTIQVKTARVREDRGGAIVIYAKKGNGQAYSTDECDLIAGVLGDTVYLFENRGIGEYWSSEATAAQRWIELTAINENNESEAV